MVLMTRCAHMTWGLPGRSGGLRRLMVAVVMAVVAWTGARAQWDVQFADYTTLKSFYNPAMAGTDGLLNVAAAYSMQFAGFDNAPKTIYAGADMPIYFLTPRHGAGLSLLNDKFGMFSSQMFSLQYAYNFAFGKKKNHKIAIGVQPMVLSEKIDPSGLIFEDNTDPAIPSSAVDGTAFDASVGVYYTCNKFWAGASVMHLMAPLVEMGETNEIQVDRSYYLMGGCNIKLKNTLITLAPSFMVQTDLQSWREDVQCKVYYEYEGRKFYAGIGYSPDISTTVLLGGNFHGIGLGYSYQMYTSGIEMVNGSHEIVLSYQTDLDLFKKGRNKHKSVRFL